MNTNRETDRNWGGTEPSALTEVLHSTELRSDLSDLLKKDRQQTVQ